MIIFVTALFLDAIHEILLTLSLDLLGPGFPLVCSNLSHSRQDEDSSCTWGSAVFCNCPDLLRQVLLLRPKEKTFVLQPKIFGFFSIKSYGEVFPWMMVHIIQLISLPWSDKSFNLKELTDECPYFVSWAYFGHNLIIHRKKYFINIRANQQNLIISYWALVNHISWKRYDNKKQNAKETP